MPAILAGAIQVDASVVIYAGGSTIGDTWVHLPQPSSVTHFGRELAAAGDVDGDGCDDLLIGHQAGALLYGGDADLTLVSELALTCSAEEASLAALGDTDGDAIQRVAIGVASAAAGALTGAGVVTLGDVHADGQRVDLTLRGTEESCGLGRAVRGLGDLDGDGLTELAIQDEDGWTLVWGDGRFPEEEQDSGDPADDTAGDGAQADETGCGCTTRGAFPAGWAWLALVGLALRRRRRQR